MPSPWWLCQQDSTLPMKWLAVNWFLGIFHRMFSTSADWLLKGQPNVISHFQARRSNHNRENKTAISLDALLKSCANSNAIDNEKFYVEKATKLELPISARGNVRMDFAEASDEPCSRVKLKSAAGEGYRVSNLFYDPSWWIHRQWKFTSMFAVAAWALSVQKRFVATSYSIKTLFFSRKWKMLLGWTDPLKKDSLYDSSSSHTRVIMLSPAFPRLPSMILRLTTP